LLGEGDPCLAGLARNILMPVQHDLTLMPGKSGLTPMHIPAFRWGKPPNAPETHLTKLVDFDVWWDKEIIFRDDAGLFPNRRRLVDSMRNQDGGGHVDTEITDSGYISISRESLWKLMYEGKLTPLNMLGHLALMRQIAWEVQMTINGKLVTVGDGNKLTVNDLFKPK
jgi:hypothetical protein